MSTVAGRERRDTDTVPSIQSEGGCTQLDLLAKGASQRTSRVCHLQDTETVSFWEEIDADGSLLINL
jgi:hypothetical protein